MQDKSRNKPKNTSNCPDTEIMTYYIEGILPTEEAQTINQHIGVCKNCKEIFDVQRSVAESQREKGLIAVPNYLTERARNLVDKQAGINVLDLIMEFTDKAIGIVRTTGDILLGEQLQPAYALRSKEIESVTTQTIVKIFKDVRIEVEASRQKGDFNKFILRAKDIKTENPSDGLRITLVKDDLEIESYITESGKAIFEDIRPSKYLIRISRVDDPIGVIILDISKK